MSKSTPDGELTSWYEISPHIPKIWIVFLVVAILIALCLGLPRLVTPRIPHAIRPALSFFHEDTRRDLVSDAYAMGKQAAASEIKTAKLMAEISEASARALELEQVVVFTDCIERRSGKPFKIAFERGKHNEACRAETVSKTGEEIAASARAIIARKKIAR